MRIPDYYVRFVDFPPTVLGATLPNDDGTFSVYINARLGDDARRETLRHELEHMARDHFYRDAPVAAQEAEAVLARIRSTLANLEAMRDDTAAEAGRLDREYEQLVTEGI